MRDLKILKKHFDFTDDDLAANREGRLSERQTLKFQAELTTASLQQASVIVALLIVYVLTIVFFALLGQFGAQLGNAICIAVVVWFALMIAVIQLSVFVLIRFVRWSIPNDSHWIYKRIRRFKSAEWQALSRSVVSRTAGQLRFQSDGEHDYLFLGDEEFMNNVMVENDERLWELEEGQAYAIYFVPNVMWITAVEPIENPVGEA